MFKKDNNLYIISQIFLNQKESNRLALPNDASVHTGVYEKFSALITRHLSSRQKFSRKQCIYLNLDLDPCIKSNGYLEQALLSMFKDTDHSDWFSGAF